MGAGRTVDGSRFDAAAIPDHFETTRAHKMDIPEKSSIGSD